MTAGDEGPATRWPPGGDEDGSAAGPQAAPGDGGPTAGEPPPTRLPPADPRDAPDRDAAAPPNVVRLRPAEVHNAPPGRRGPARDAAARHAAGAPAPTFDFATGKERAAPGSAPDAPGRGPGAAPGDGVRGGPPRARHLPPGRSSPSPSKPPDQPFPDRAPKPRRHQPHPDRAPTPPDQPLLDRAPTSPRRGAADPVDAQGAPPTDALPAGAAPAARTVALRSRAPRRPERRAPGAPRRLGVPVLTPIRADAGGRPVVVDGDPVDAVRESWLIEDRWWTDRPLRRRYWEVVTAGGRDLIVFRDLVDARWYRQR